MERRREIPIVLGRGDVVVITSALSLLSLLVEESSLEAEQIEKTLVKFEAINTLRLD